MDRVTSNSPYFSIVIPVYNRAKLVGRTLRSCFSQTFADFEIIVVDDGSTDESVQAVQEFDDPRLTVVCHERNRGVGPARNTGVSHAVGEWIVPLDSDDELLPDALSIMYRRAMESGENIDRLQFMVQGDDGALSPEPSLKDEIWGYEDYIRWVELICGRRSETLPIVRRRTFGYVRYYDDRTLESPYHLDFMKRFRARSCPDVVRLYHHDALNQLSVPNFDRLLGDARTKSMAMEQMLNVSWPGTGGVRARYLFQAVASLSRASFSCRQTGKRA